MDLLEEMELPSGPCFIYGNHSNNYDPFILNAFTRLGEATAGVMTMEYLKAGPLAKLFSAAGIVGTKKRVPEPHLIRKIWRMLDQGRRVVIFPEGGRRWDGRPAPWIESTAKLFMRAGVPVYPVEIIGSYVAWPRWAQWPRPARIRLKVHDAVDFSDSPSLEEGIERLKYPIQQDENVVPDEVAPHRAFRPAAGIDRLLYRDPTSGMFGGLNVTSGSTLSSTSSGLTWRVNPDSTLTDLSTGEKQYSADFYARLRALPLPSDSAKAITQGDGDVIIESDEITSDKVRNVLRNVQCALWSDRVEIGDLIYGLDQIRYMGLERSDRVWFMTGSEQVKIQLNSSSVLAWYDVLTQLAPHINS